MGLYPVYLVVFAVIVVGFTIWSRMRLKQGMAQSADKTIGALGARLGLAVAEGDPSTNLLYFQQPSGDYSRQLRLVGQPNGRPVSFTVVDGQKTSEYIVARKITTSFGCFLEAQLAVQVPAFEAVLRQPTQYLEPHQEMAERTDLAVVATGRPDLDAGFIVRAADPRIGPLIAGALAVLGTQLFVHLAGEGNRVWVSITRMGLPYFAGTAESYLLALETAARALEGR
jgi:hypothetical protein